jgi:ribonuclease P/MRP protein subunit POP1
MSKRYNATAGPSSSGNAAGKGRIVKTISRTTDLLKQNEGSSRNGKGKEKEILGDMQPAMAGQSIYHGRRSFPDSDADAKSLPGVVSVEKFAKVCRVIVSWGWYYADAIFRSERWRSWHSRMLSSRQSQYKSSLMEKAVSLTLGNCRLQGNTRVFQSLPRHLRRRAASHNPRRVPARLRSRAAAEVGQGPHTTC